jgi:hypothetical protein
VVKAVGYGERPQLGSNQIRRFEISGFALGFAPPQKVALPCVPLAMFFLSSPLPWSLLSHSRLWLLVLKFHFPWPIKI